jgi:hypothetical protein
MENASGEDRLGVPFTELSVDSLRHPEDSTPSRLRPEGGWSISVSPDLTERRSVWHADGRESLKKFARGIQYENLSD